MFTTALILSAIGALNWGLVGLFDFNLVSAIFGVDTIVTNIIYIIVGAAGLYMLVAHFAHMGARESRHSHSSRPVTAHR